MDLEKLNFKKYMENSFNMCNQCNIPLVMKYPRPGQTWKPFISCPNYKTHPDYKPKADNNPSPQAQNSPAINSNKANGELLIIERLDAVNKRLDDMAEFLVEKLGNKKDELPPLNEIKF